MRRLSGLFLRTRKKSILSRPAKSWSLGYFGEKVFGRAASYFQNSPDQIKLQQVIGAKPKGGNVPPDDVQERGLRQQLVERPHDFDLTYRLVASLYRLGRPLIPDQNNESLDPDVDVDHESLQLLQFGEDYASKGDTFGLYASLWQVVARNPRSPRGWAEFARAFADRADWENCRLTLSGLLAFNKKCQDTVVADLIVQALGTLAEHKELGDLAWRQWLQKNTEHKTIPGAVQLLLRAGDAADAAAISPKSIDRYPERADAWLSAAKVEFEFDRLENCYDFLRRALKLDSRFVLQALIRDFSSQFSSTVKELGKEDELADWLSSLSGSDDINLIPPLPNPESLRATRRQRSIAIDRGLPSALLITQPKSGSVSVGNIFSSGFQLPTALYSIVRVRVVASWLQNFLLGGASYVTHLQPTDRNIELLHGGGAKNVIVHVRDPRQQIISLIHHHRRYPEQLRRSNRGKFVRDDEEAIFRFMMDETFIPNTIGWIDSWYKARSKLNLKFTTFEEFVRDRSRFTERIIAFYGGDARYFDPVNAFTEHPGIDYHKRLGSIDEWRQVLNRKQIDEVNRAIPNHFWSAFGWTP